MTLTRQCKESHSFKGAVRLFLRSPQTRLVRHLCICVAQDPSYILRNRRSIEQVIHSVLSIQGLDPKEVFQEACVFDLIRVVGERLKVNLVAERWTVS